MKKFITLILLLFVALFVNAQVLHIYGGEGHDVYLGSKILTLMKIVRYGTNMELMEVRIVLSQYGMNMVNMVASIASIRHGMNMLHIHQLL